MKTADQEKLNKKIEKSPFKHHLDMPPILPTYKGSGKLAGQIAIITGGDSGIGRSISVHFAREGADVVVVYDENDADAHITKGLVLAEGRECVLIQGDISREEVCKQVVAETINRLGNPTILVNNAGTHVDESDFTKITKEQLERTFAVNIFSFFYCAKAVLEVMDKRGIIINTASVVAYRGSEHLVDYAASKGAIVAFTRSLSKNLASKNIRVNAVAPGPVWTPLVVASFDDKDLKEFGKDTPLGRAGYPYELAPAYVYLASADSSFVTGQVMHVNGGDVVNG